jgi:hypothetical protein
MRYSTVSSLSFWRLIEQFAEDVKCFVKEEGKLVKAELSEKVAYLARNSVPAAIGGCIAYIGVNLLFIAIGMIVAYAFQGLGMDPLLATSAGIGATAILVIAVGTLLLIKGIHAFSKANIKPEKTIETVENLKSEEGKAESAAKRVEKMDEEDHRNSKEIQESVFDLEEEMADTLSELGRRVSLTSAREHANKEVRAHPYRWGLVAMGTGFAGSFFLKKKAAKLVKE